MINKQWVLIALAILESSCVRSDPATEMHICVGSNDAGRFTSILATILQRMAFDPALGRAVDEHGNTNFVLEAKRGSVRVWAQNVPLNPPYRIAKLNEHTPVVNVNTKEYLVSVQGRFPLYRGNVQTIFDQLRTQILKSGFKEAMRGAECTTPLQSRRGKVT